MLIWWKDWFSLGNEPLQNPDSVREAQDLNLLPTEFDHFLYRTNLLSILNPSSSLPQTQLIDAIDENWRHWSCLLHLTSDFLLSLFNPKFELPIRLPERCHPLSPVQLSYWQTSRWFNHDGGNNVHNSHLVAPSRNIPSRPLMFLVSTVCFSTTISSTFAVSLLTKLFFNITDGQETAHGPSIEVWFLFERLCFLFSTNWWVPLKKGRN